MAGSAAYPPENVPPMDSHKQSPTTNSRLISITSGHFLLPDSWNRGPGNSNGDCDWRHNFLQLLVLAIITPQNSLIHETLEKIQYNRW
ncbi:hypothetical protein E2P81_ATG08755 [Venturia nashicola]|uniref:Uncharacterized protein n=1 Tax=Venturia nashicola TaxID=86259 RepID=A0A4Z1P627_9PEZI|nr:hypothetical protein E6O75_ATG08950 [Venturia nashicola]TLD23411.1 hypothetical protein E2P81_ATG08755 [Venturia nashicola]